jgi:pilus assembly protein CpaF
MVTVEPAAPARFLLIQAPDGAAERIVLREPRVVIGRDPSCDVVLRSSEVSRQHAVLEWNGDSASLEDSSANGTDVDGTLVHRRRASLQPGARIAIGPFNVRVEDRAPALAPVRGTADVAAETRRQIRRKLLDHLDLVRLERDRLNSHLLRSKVKLALDEIVASMRHFLPAGTDPAQLVVELLDETLGLGPLEVLLADDTVTEIMVLDPRVIYIERDGRIEKTDHKFTDDDSVRSVLERIMTPLGRRIDESSPMLDARLQDGSRVNAIIPPLAVRGTCITIRKFPKERFGRDDLIRFGALTDRMATFLHRAVVTRKNILVAGGTGSGKTTLLNILSSSIPEAERIVTIEDAAELQLRQPHVVPLEARPSNMEGRGEVPIRALVKNAMRMRPDRIIVGECRGGEALDMLQAMNTGHEGSMTTTHANSPHEALKRIETLALMAGLDLPARAIREQIAASIDLLVQQARFADGSRKIIAISEVVGLTDEGQIEIREIYRYRRTGTEADGTVVGEFGATGYLPSFIEDFVVQGLVPAEGGDYL